MIAFSSVLSQLQPASRTGAADLLRIANHSDTSASSSDTAAVADIGCPRANAGEGSCEKIQDRLFPARSVRGSARFRLQILSRDGSRSFGFNFFTAPRGQGVRGYVSADSISATEPLDEALEKLGRSSCMQPAPAFG